MTTCIHHNDLDGRCAAAIVHHANKIQKFSKDPIKFIEADYKDLFDFTEIGPTERVFIVDFSLSPPLMEILLKQTGHVIWIDHHATARDYPYQNLGGLRDFADKSMSGCELTWDYFFYGIPLPDAVRLIGDYDKWALKYQPECFQFYEGAKLIADLSDPTSDTWGKLLSMDDGGGPERIIEQGKVAIQYRDNKSFGYETEIGGHKAYACNQFMFGSGGLGERFHHYPVCLAYIHDGRRFTVSLYSETVDVGSIAKAHGGGGHKGAAGFVCNELPWSKNA